MRSFADAEGKPWQAALLDASYGTVLLVFSRLGADTVRKIDLHAENLAAAQAMLEAMGEAELRANLARAEPWA